MVGCRECGKHVLWRRLGSQVRRGQKLPSNAGFLQRYAPKRRMRWPADGYSAASQRRLGSLKETRRNAACRSAIRCFDHLGSSLESRVSRDLDGLANIQSRMARANRGYQLADGDNFGVRPDGCPGVGSVDIRPTKRCRSGGVSYGGSWRSQIHRAGTRSARRW